MDKRMKRKIKRIKIPKNMRKADLII